MSPGSGNGRNNRGEPVCDTQAMPWVQCPPTDACPAEAKVAGDNHWCALDRSKLTLPLEDDAVLSYGQAMLRANAANITTRPFFLAVGFVSDSAAGGALPLSLFLTRFLAFCDVRIYHLTQCAVCCC
eukprot:COSAG05_NODE_507_length_9159_cov_53.489183_8_plen_127_part_00